MVKGDTAYILCRTTPPLPDFCGGRAGALAGGVFIGL